jgi:hypothetical protein
VLPPQRCWPGRTTSHPSYSYAADSSWQIRADDLAHHHFALRRESLIDGRNTPLFCSQSERRTSYYNWYFSVILRYWSFNFKIKGWSLSQRQNIVYAWNKNQIIFYTSKIDNFSSNFSTIFRCELQCTDYLCCIAYFRSIYYIYVLYRYSICFYTNWGHNLLHKKNSTAFLRSSPLFLWEGIFKVCVVCSSSIYGFWLPIWYLQTLLS